MDEILVPAGLARPEQRRPAADVRRLEPTEYLRQELVFLADALVNVGDEVGEGGFGGGGHGCAQENQP